MRQVGSIENEQQARLFADYLVSEGIAAQAEQEEGEWAIWVRDENHVQSAAEKLQAFVEDPSDHRYRGVSRRAEEMRRQELQRRDEARRNTVEIRRQWRRGVARRTPLLLGLIGASVLVAIITSFGERVEPVISRLTFCQIQPVEKGFLYPPDYFQQIKQGELWRMVTPIFIHFGLIHLLFNMYMLYYLGAQIESRLGTLWFGFLVVVMAVGSNVAQAYLSQTFHNEIVGSSPLFGGMSGVDYGLFGYIWMKTVYSPQSGLHVSQGTVFVLLAWLVICLAPSMHVANGAHGAGLAIGVALGYAPELWGPRRG